MIQRISKGKGYGGCVRYVRNKPGAQIIGGSYAKDATAAEITADLGLHGHAGAKTTKPVFHAALSLAPGEVLSDSQWNEVARRYLEAQGLTESPFLLVRHTDRPLDHVHIITTRLRYDGTLVSDSKDRERGAAVLRRLERELHLRSPQGKAQERTPSLAERHRADRTGSPNLRKELQQLVRSAAADGPDLPTFVRRLEARGVEVRLNRTTSNTIRGLSFEFRGLSWRGSSLGRSFSWQGLQTTVSYDPKRDDALLARSNSQAQSSNTWSQGVLSDLASRLSRLRISAGQAPLATAASSLLNEGHTALSSTARALHLINAVRHPARALLREAPGGDTLSLGLAFVGAFSSPATGVSFALSLLGRGLSRIGHRSGSGLRPRDTSSRTVLRQFLGAALSDRPSPEVFFERLAECGIAIEFPRPGSLSYRVGDVLVAGRSLGRAFTPDGLATSLGATHERVVDSARRIAHPGTWLSPGSALPSGPAQPPRSAAQALERDSGGAPTPPERSRPARPEPPGSHIGSQPRSLNAQGEPAPTPALERGGRASYVVDPAVDSPRALPAVSGLEPRPVGPPGARDRQSDHDRLLPPVSRSAGSVSPAPGANERLGFAGAHLRALNAQRFDVRLGSGAAIEVLPNLTSEALLARVASIPLHTPVAVRAAEPTAARFLGWTDAKTLAQATARGFEPSIVVETGGRLAVWLQHSPVADPVRPYLDRSVSLVYGQAPKTLDRSFGPLAGFGPAPGQLVHCAGLPYSRGPELVEVLTAARSERLAQLSAKLQAAGVPSLGFFTASSGGDRRASEVEWARLALARGLSRPDVAAILVTQSSRRLASPKAQLAHATKTLAAAISPAPSPPALLRIAASTAGLSLKLLSTALKLVRLGQSLAR